jgi:small-conductance mechanosensitive channel
MTFREIVQYRLIDSENVTLTISHLFFIILAIILIRLILVLIKKFLNRPLVAKKIDPSKSFTIYQFFKYFIWILAIGLILDSVGIKMTLLVAGSAALFVGIGFGLQNIFKDILSGIILLIEEHLGVNDVIQLDGGIVGRVKQITLRTTLIETRENIIMIIPNSEFIEKRVINWSHLDELSRFSVTVGVAYGSDVELVQDVLLDVAMNNKNITSKNKPFVRFTNFGDSSLDFELFFWTSHSFIVENIKSDLRFEINKAFIEKEISIPFPQRDVHLKKD